ncbi:MAG: DnaD domain protein [Lachnospiraceae bacterium]|nr:DnaD domain protein [Lachnospiraceae bacterium]
MGSIILKGNRYSGNTIVSNCFIDEYMADANGAQLKIYLYLMRCIEADEPVSVPLLADRFNYTETDIIRSLLYWARKGIISIEFDDDRNVSGIILNDPSEAQETEVSLPKKSPAKTSEGRQRPSYSPAELSDFETKSEIKQLIFAAEQYLGHLLTPSDMKTMLFIYDKQGGLGFSADLIEFLIEYCVGKGKTGTRYIEQTAMNWADAGIKDVAEAKKHIRGFAGNEYFTVLKAYGISDRNPVDSEIEYIDQWKNGYGFSMDIILEAVSRTMKAIAKPSFPYTDTILKRWSESGVTSLADIDMLLSVWGSTAKQTGASRVSASPAGISAKRSVQNKFHNFSERQYDMEELEARILGKKQSKKVSRV